MTKSHYKFIALLGGVILSVIFYFLNPFSVSEPAARVLAVAVLMITWWVTEALPMPVVALLPLILFPLLRISELKDASAPYANPVIFLFLGGFMLGLAIEKWNLHRRIALNIVRLTGTSGNGIILGFIIATGMLSMWLSNTATTMMMFPIALSVLQVVREGHGISNPRGVANFSIAIMLAIAYASNIGGIATIIGTPPNVAYVLYIKEKFGHDINFMSWMLLCTPLAITLLAALYLVLVKWLFPNRILSDHSTRDVIHEELSRLGPMKVSEKRVLGIFAGTAFLWITRQIINDLQDLVVLDDTIIAVMCAVALFICPSGESEGRDSSILEWSDTSKMAWGILLLFGGGLALAGALEKAGLIQQLGEWLARFGASPLLLLFLVVLLSLFISEVTSNVAQVIVFAPVVTSLAIAMKLDPLLLGIPMTLAASCAGMLPMGTPPNAIVFSSGHIKLGHMVKAGFVMNLVAVALVTLFGWYILPLLVRL
jgi:solute carrier family 13 (sodium-dependent dicarboxylate transporter), member 2/3/5